MGTPARLASGSLLQFDHRSDKLVTTFRLRTVRRSPRFGQADREDSLLADYLASLQSSGCDSVRDSEAVLVALRVQKSGTPPMLIPTITLKTQSSRLDKLQRLPLLTRETFEKSRRYTVADAVQNRRCVVAAIKEVSLREPPDEEPVPALDDPVLTLKPCGFPRAYQTDFDYMKWRQPPPPNEAPCRGNRVAVAGDRPYPLSGNQINSSNALPSRSLRIRQTHKACHAPPPTGVEFRCFPSGISGTPQRAVGGSVLASARYKASMHGQAQWDADVRLGGVIP